MTSLTRQVQARLDTMLGPSSPAQMFHRVGVAADAMAVGGELRTPIEAWVVSFDTDAAGPRNATGPIRQLVKESVLIMLGFLYSGHIGEEGDPELVEDAVITALMGWVPDGRADSLSLRGSRLMSFDSDKQILFRQVVFETSRQRVASL
jgi:hypothetical protein